RQAEQRDLLVQMVAKRTGRDLLRNEPVVVIVATTGRGAPVAAVTGRARVQVQVGGRRGFASVAWRISCRRCRQAGGESCRQGRPILFVGLLEKGIFLQQPLHLRIELQRREL